MKVQKAFFPQGYLDISVIVTEAFSPYLFFVQMKKFQKELTELEQDLERAAKVVDIEDEEEDFNFKVGDYCIAEVESPSEVYFARSVKHFRNT